jgi:hypothetical protein
MVGDLAVTVEESVKVDENKLVNTFVNDYSDSEEESDFSDFDDDEMYIDDYDDWNDRSVASHGLTGEQSNSSHPNRQVLKMKLFYILIHFPSMLLNVQHWL